MQGSSVEWTEKYRPKTLHAIVGNEEAIEKLAEWGEELFKAKAKKAALLIGPAGCGKTSAAYALASEKGWEVIELNASDQRSEGVIKKIVGPASTSTTFSQMTRLIILDEADNLHGTEDRGGTKAISEIVKKSTQPIILTANDKYKIGRTLLHHCKLIPFQRIKPGTIFRVLKRLSDEEGLQIADEVLLTLAKKAHGDLRSAINDLQALAISETRLEEANGRDMVLGERDIEEDIFAVLKKIFGVEARDLQETLSSLYTLDKTPEESIQWIYKNFSYEYDPASFLHGLQYLSRADMFLGRARQRENFKFWRYASSLMAGGMRSAQEKQGARGKSREERRPQYFRPPWLRQPRSSEERRSAPIQEEIAKRVATYSKVPVSYARYGIVPLLPILFQDERKAVDITASLGLDMPQIAFLLEETETEARTREEKVERIYHDARTVATSRGKDEEPEASVVIRSIKKEEAGKYREPVSAEEGGEEEEGETARNQKTLADFF
ncbi:MAG: replication factor C large subunit [Methanophagales archaeon ANME-1-THS]|nr:MAG: replication factor C large subunit [Methanophagales archaeon ANME-1-THS]